MRDDIAINHLESLQKRNENGELGDLYQEEYDKALSKGIKAIKILQKIGKWAIRESDDDYMVPEILRKEESYLGNILYEIAQSSIYFIVTEKKEVYLAFPGIIWTHGGPQYLWNTVNWKQGWGRQIPEWDVMAYTEIIMKPDTYEEICNHLSEVD